ncbi:hypothetical protein JYJ95_39970 [Corallococcus exiguus]|uniref:hypothetical protein n=1 Tax=Corallococcus exiguus TaxID=83462 RepID=UPI001A8EACCB|nr:hypothetical protein [Corallococcus exiguus]MBN8472718.1 hypothetical protein [Corallococcus exiguus]
MKTNILRSNGTWALLLGVLLLWGGAARAELAAVACVGTTDTRYQPGLKNTEQLAKFTGDASLRCTGVPFLLLTPASIHTEGQAPLSCDLSLFSPVRSRFVIQWGDGTTSTAEAEPIVNEKQGGQFVLVVRGKVVEGRFPGALVTRTLISPTLDLNVCDSPQGVTRAEGLASLEVVSLP